MLRKLSYKVHYTLMVFFLMTIMLTSSILPAVSSNFQNQAFAEKGGTDKITICHKPPGNLENDYNITVSEKDLDAHLAHGDTFGNPPQLVEEYLELITKLNDLGLAIESTTITQELIDDVNVDLSRIKEIVIELQNLCFDGEVAATRVGTQMVGTVKFFDSKTSEILFEVVIPFGTLSIFYAFGIIEEFENGGFFHSLEEQGIIINSAPELLSSFINFEDDEIVGELVLGSIGIFHPSTGNTVHLKLFNIIRKVAVKIQKSVSQCLSDLDCTDDVFDVLEEAAEVLYKTVSFQTVTIPVTKFNDVNVDGIFDTNETGLTDWQFLLSVFTPDEDPGIPLEIIYDIDTTNDNGELTFSVFIPASATRLHVVELLQPGWDFTNPDDGEHTLDYDHNVNVAYDRIFFGNQKIDSTPPVVPGVDFVLVDIFCKNKILLDFTGLIPFFEICPIKRIR